MRRVGVGAGGGARKERSRRLVSALSRFSAPNGPMFPSGNPESVKEILKLPKSTSEEVTSDSREGQMRGNADKA